MGPAPPTVMLRSRAQAVIDTLAACRARDDKGRRSTGHVMILSKTPRLVDSARRYLGTRASRSQSGTQSSGHHYAAAQALHFKFKLISSAALQLRLLFDRFRTSRLRP